MFASELKPIQAIDTLRIDNSLSHISAVIPIFWKLNSMTPDGWKTVETARADGMLCKLLLLDERGYHEPEAEHFLGSDGFWYCLRPMGKLSVAPHRWKPL